MLKNDHFEFYVNNLSFFFIFWLFFKEISTTEEWIQL